MYPAQRLHTSRQLMVEGTKVLRRQGCPLLVHTLPHLIHAMGRVSPEFLHYSPPHRFDDIHIRAHSWPLHVLKVLLLQPLRSVACYVGRGIVLLEHEGMIWIAKDHLYGRP